MEKTVKFEIVEVKKTEEENNLDKAITNFKEICSIYEKLIGNGGDLEELKEKRIDIIQEINKRSNDISNTIKRHIHEELTNKGNKYSL